MKWFLGIRCRPDYTEKNLKINIDTRTQHGISFMNAALKRNRRSRTLRNAEVFLVSATVGKTAIGDIYQTSSVSGSSSIRYPTPTSVTI